MTLGKTPTELKSTITYQIVSFFYSSMLVWAKIKWSKRSWDVIYLKLNHINNQFIYIYNNYFKFVPEFYGHYLIRKIFAKFYN